MQREIVKKLTCSSSSSNENAAPLSMSVRMRKGSPRPKLMSKTLEPMAFDTAISANPSLATSMELIASWRGGGGE